MFSRGRNRTGPANPESNGELQPWRGDRRPGERESLTPRGDKIKICATDGSMIAGYMAFASLRAHTTHSLLDSAMTVDGYAKALKNVGCTTAAVTDSANLGSVVPWFKASKKHGIRPIFGVILWLEPSTRVPDVNPALTETGGSLLLLVRDQVGFEHLSHLVSLGTERPYGRPRVTIEQVLDRAVGLNLIFPFDHGLPYVQADATESLRTLVNAFRSAGGLIGLEVHDHGEGWETGRRLQTEAFATAFNLPLVATNAARYAHPADAHLLPLVRSVASKQSVDRMTAWQASTDQAHVLDEAALRDRCGDAACDATLVFAETCRWEPKTGIFHFPRSEPPVEMDLDAQWTWLCNWFPAPKIFGAWVPTRPSPSDLTTLGEDASLLDGYFATFAERGLEIRHAAGQIPDLPLYIERLRTEIQLIRKMGFSAYMLVVAEFIGWAADHGIAVGPGRGSVAGSMVAWAMRITEVDPIKFTLLFERFLNPARISMPDVDVDFAVTGRERVIAHVVEKYGAEKVGQICNFGTFGPKSAFKDTMRVLSTTFGESNRVSGWFDDGAETVAQALKSDPRLKTLVEIDPVVRRATVLAEQLCGDPTYVKPGEKAKPDPLMRQRGIHAAGVVVAPAELWRHAPVHADLEGGRRVLGIDMDGVDTLGLVKFDFLGLKTLDVIEESLDSIEATTGQRPDLDAIPLDDPAVYTMLGKGDVLGLFQVESSGMQNLLLRLKPSGIEDIIALLALYRPGPLSSGMVDDFVERKHGRQPIVDLHPCLHEILKPTYGIMTYQEQILEVARELSGFTLSEADLLRRAISKKKPDEMAAQRAKFIGGASERGTSEETSQRIFDMIDGFSAYCFNKSHSAAYGIITYRTAWLKAHHPAAFLAAACSWEASDHDTLALYVRDAQRRGLSVLPPCINRSLDRFTVEGPALRYGLRAIKGLGAEALTALLVERETSGLYRSLPDFVTRLQKTAVNRRIVNLLIDAGAFDAIVPRRDVAAWWWDEQSNPVKLKARKQAEREQKKADRQREKERIAEEKRVERERKKEEKARGRQEALFGIEPVPTTTALVDSPPVEADPAESSEEALPTFDLTVGVPLLRLEDLPTSEAWSVLHRLQREAAVLGTWLSGHPLDRDADVALRVASVSIAALVDFGAKKTIDLVGAIEKIHQIKTKRGEKMTFVQISDRTGSAETVCFPSVAQKYKSAIEAGRTVRVRGALDRPGAEGKLIVAEIEALDEVRRRGARTIRLAVEGGGFDQASRREQMLGLLRTYAGRCPVRLDRGLFKAPPSAVAQPTVADAATWNEGPLRWHEVILAAPIVRLLGRLARLASPESGGSSSECALASRLFDENLAVALPPSKAFSIAIDPDWATTVEKCLVVPSADLIDALERFYGEPGKGRAVL